ncbi:MAG: hypothetical protein M3401_07000 [Actinomycetota bacterium]|nr:hypothetical protein [Actinomycetota bacterium]
MNAVRQTIERIRLRDAPAQVREAHRLARDMTYSDMVIGNALGHAIHHDRDVTKLLKRMRKTDPGDEARLDELLEEVRHHHAEFERIRRLDEPITRYDERGEPITPDE